MVESWSEWPFPHVTGSGVENAAQDSRGKCGFTPEELIWVQIIILLKLSLWQRGEILSPITFILESRH